MDDQLKAMLEDCYIARDNYLAVGGRNAILRTKAVWLEAEATLAKEIELRVMQAVVKELKETNDMLERALR